MNQLATTSTAVDWPYRRRALPAELRALRVALAVALDRETAAACMDGELDGAVTLWPSSLYGLLAAAAAHSPVVWHRCSRLVDAELGPAASQFENIPLNTLTRLFIEGRDVLSTRELAGVLWAVLRRRDPAAPFIGARLGAELEIIATRRASRNHAGGASNR
jgi:hypothetical protein